MKTKYITILVIFALAFSCKTQSEYKLESGTYRYYYKATTDTEELILNDDSTFIINSYRTSCSGKWKYIRPNTIVISCEDVDLMQKIQSGYMTLRQREIKVIGNNRLQLPIANNTKMKSVVLNKEY